MPADKPRFTPQTAQVLDAMIQQDGLSGVELGKLAGLLSGTLYPLLLRLEEAGLVTSSWEAGDPRELGRPRRRFYSITNAGRAFVRSAAAAQISLFTRLASA